MAVAGAWGCGLNVQGNYERLRPALVRHDTRAADAYMAAAKNKFYGGHNALLYAMDRGMVLHVGGDYRRSNACIEVAKDLEQKLYTQSISQNAAAWLTTDEAMPYQGEDFEKVMLHIVAALNYLALGEQDDARVEARQVTERLGRLAAQTEGQPRAYRDDAFAHWLSGLLYEATSKDPGALSEAWIDYRRALQLYAEPYREHYNMPVPRQLLADAQSLLHDLGPEFTGELDALQQRFGPVPQAAPRVTAASIARASTASMPHAGKATTGRVVFVHEMGEAPYKVDRFWTVPVGLNILRIAYPAFVAKRHAIVQARLHLQPAAAAPTTTATELVEDLAQIAVHDLDDHMGRIRGRAVARAVSKFTAGAALQVAGAAGGGGKGALMEVAGFVFNTTNAFIEHADKRSWLTLPAQLGLAEAVLPAGPLTLDVDYVDALGRVMQRAQLRGVVPAGGILFMSGRTLL